MDFSQFLDFEKPVVEIERELVRLRSAVERGELALVTDVEKLEKRLEKVRADVYGNLTAYQRVRLSRHFERPMMLDYVERLFGDFSELHGDRVFGDDPAVVAGLARFVRTPVCIVGHQRGKGTQDRIRRNFGMPQPEGYRKAQRMYKMAEKFQIPLMLFIDTQGAYPGLEAEMRGQAEAIASCLAILASLRTPIISVVIGEGGSGGALALGICDRLLMLENSTYSVITPEGCASILWGKKDPEGVGEHAKVAAESLKLTARSLLEAQVCDEVIKEPPGGAHRDPDAAADALAIVLGRHLAELQALPMESLLAARYEKFRRVGAMR